MSADPTDDLNRPLGQRTAPEKPPLITVRRSVLLAGNLVIAGAVTAIVILRDPNAGDPSGMSPIVRRPAEVAAAPPAALTAAPPAAPQKRVMDASDLEDAAGVRVVRGGNSAAPGSVVIHVAPQTRSRLPAAPDKRLVEKSRFGGVLPKIGSDGARPSQVYARPLGADAAGKPRIAIVVGGMGISRQSTDLALAQLPGEITFAFAPYAGDLEKLAQRARAEGHELLIQAPMEPFDFPANDPGPHTLRSDLSEKENLDRLHFVLSRFPGYVGVTNFMGAKFTAQDGALKPVLREFADRGLLFIDDGSSARSLAGDIAPGLRLDAAKADMVIDAIGTPKAIDDQLARLEEIARTRGFAIGSASALPVSIARLAQWSKALDARGIVLVPVSATIAAGRRS